MAEKKSKLLSEILADKTGVDLRFTNFEVDETQAGLPIIRLTLEKPMTFYGRRITDNVSGDTVRLQSPDVEIINIGNDTIDAIKKMEEDGEEVITWEEEGKSGRIKHGKLFTDVSQNQEAWIVVTKFAKFAADRRNERRADRTSALVSKIRNDETRKEFGVTGQGKKVEVVS